jgi:hypothetical protein
MLPGQGGAAKAHGLGGSAPSVFRTVFRQIVQAPRMHAYVYVKDIQIPAIARKGGSAEGAEGNLPYFFLNKA